jgi:hypothetical protein
MLLIMAQVSKEFVRDIMNSENVITCSPQDSIDTGELIGAQWMSKGLQITSSDLMLIA